MQQNNSGSGQWSYFNPSQRLATPNLLAPPAQNHVSTNPMEVFMQAMAQYMSQQLTSNLSSMQPNMKNNMFNAPNIDNVLAQNNIQNVNNSVNLPQINSNFNYSSNLASNNDSNGNLLNSNQIQGHNVNNMANINNIRNIGNNTLESNMGFVNPQINFSNGPSKMNIITNSQNLQNATVYNSEKNATKMIGEITQYLTTSATLINKNGPNSPEALLVRQLQCVLVQQMVNNNIIDDGQIVKQFIKYLEGKIIDNSNNLSVQKMEKTSTQIGITNDLDVRLTPLPSTYSFGDNLETKRNSSQHSNGEVLSTLNRNCNLSLSKSINNNDDNYDTGSFMSNRSDEEENILLSKLKKKKDVKNLPCGICGENVTGNYVKCIKCNKYVHKECSDISGKIDDSNFKVINYVCPSCSSNTLVVSDNERNVSQENMMKSKPKIGPASFKAKLKKMTEEEKVNSDIDNLVVLTNTSIQSKTKRGRRKKKTNLSESASIEDIGDCDNDTGKRYSKNISKGKKNSENYDADYLPEKEDLLYDPPRRSCTRNVSYTHAFDFNQSSLQSIKKKKNESINLDAQSMDLVNDFVAMPAINNDNKFLGELKQEGIATVFAQNPTDDVVNAQLIPSLNFKLKPDLRQVYFGSLALIPEVVIEWLHMISPNLRSNNCTQCLFCQTLFKQSNDFIEHLKSEHSDLLFAVGKQIPEDINKVLFMGCRHCNFQTFDLTLMIIHFECKHGLSDISDGSKLPPRPPILLSTNMTRILPNDLVVADESFSCFDCDMILTGPDSARSLLNHVLVDHPDTEHCNGCFVRINKFLKPTTSATNFQVVNDDNFAQLRFDTFGCLYCNFLTECNYEALAHNITVHLIKKIVYTCPSCDYKTIFMNRMSNHLERLHTDLERGYCTVSMVEDFKECFIENRLALDY